MASSDTALPGHIERSGWTRFGWVLVALLLAYAGAFVVATGLSLLLYPLTPVVMTAPTAVWLLVGLLYVVVVNALTPVVLLSATAGLRELNGVLVWVLVGDAVLRLASSVARGFGLPRWIGYGFESFWAYDFTQGRWTWALAVALGAVSTLVAVWASSVVRARRVSVSGVGGARAVGSRSRHRTTGSRQTIRRP